MESLNARSLSNDFQDVQLYSLRHWSEANLLAPADGHGPYVIMQSGIDPQDPGLEVDDFILGKDGRWLPLYLFQPLSKDQRRSRYIFATAAEAITVLGSLPGKPIVERGTTEPEEGETTTVDDPLNQAISAARQHGPTLAPTT